MTKSAHLLFALPARHGARELAQADKEALSKFLELLKGNVGKKLIAVTYAHRYLHEIDLAFEE